MRATATDKPDLHLVAAGITILDFRVEAEGNVWPMVPAGAALNETIEAPEHARH